MLYKETFELNETYAHSLLNSLIPRGGKQTPQAGGKHKVSWLRIIGITSCESVELS